MFPSNCEKISDEKEYERFKRFLIKTQQYGLHQYITNLDSTRYVKEIKSECKVALLQIEKYAGVESRNLELDRILIRSDIVKVDFLMKNLTKSSEHLICKSMSCFYKMLEDISLINKNSVKRYLSDNSSKEFLDEISKLLDHKNSCVVREVCRVLSSFISKPDFITCWLKLEYENIGVDSSCIRHAKIRGAPQKIPKNTGFYHLINMHMIRSVRGNPQKYKKDEEHKFITNFNFFKDEDEDDKENEIDDSLRDEYQLEFFSWGVIFNYGDTLELMPPIKISNNGEQNITITKQTGEGEDTEFEQNNSWTIMVRIHFPPIVTFNDHVL